MDASIFITMRNDIQKLMYLFETFFFGSAVEMSHTTALGMNICTAETGCSNIFIGHTLDYFWTGDKHLADIINNKDKICDSRAVYSTTGTVSRND